MRRLAVALVAGIAVYLAADEFRDGIAQMNRARRELRAEMKMTVSGANSFSIADEAVNFSSDPVGVANQYLLTHKQDLMLRRYHEFKPRMNEEPFGTTVKYDIFQNGVPLIGMGIQVHVGHDLSILGIENDYRPVLKADLSSPGLSPAAIVARLRGRYLADENSLKNVSYMLYLDSTSAMPELAYVLNLREASGRRRPSSVLLRASDGTVLNRKRSVSDPG